MSNNESQNGSSKCYISQSYFGKRAVQLFYVHRDGPIHTIKDLRISTHLTLDSHKEHKTTENTNVIDTVSQMNSVFILAKKHGITSPEEFGSILCSFFISTYSHVKKAAFYLEEDNWDRLSYDEESNGKLHNHAFVFSPKFIHTARVELVRGEEFPTIISGIKNMRLLKTTNCSFKNFGHNDHRTLTDVDDRIFCLFMNSSWNYKKNPQIDFYKTFNAVKESVFYNFAGDLEKGVMSTSAQNTIYKIEKDVMEKINEINSIEMTLLNTNYAVFDFSRFNIPSDVENVFYPQSELPSQVHVKMERE